MEAAEYLAQQMKQATVITTLFAPKEHLEDLGEDFFPVLGREPETVATVLVDC